MKLNTRFSLLLVFLTIASLTASLCILISIQSAIKQAESLNTRHISSIIVAKDLKFHTIQVQQWLTDISATRGLDGLNDGLDLAEVHAKDFQKNLDKLVQLLPEYRDTLIALRSTFETYHQVGIQMAEAYIKSGPQGGNPMMERFDTQSSKINQKVDEVVKLISKQVNAVSTEHNEQLVRTGIISIVASFLVLIAILILYTNFSAVLKRLPLVETWLADMREGKINIDIKVDQHNSISEIVYPIEDLRNVLEDIISGIRNTVSKLSSEAKLLFDITRSACTKLGEQQNEILQVATAANEMSASSHDVANSIANASEALAAVNSETINGQAIVSDAISSIDLLSNHIRVTTDKINKFGNQTESITTLMDEINSIAEQTNLLALNAAIEAARAGEQGRGFAVVADEVRTLASRTQESTEEINRMIQGLNTAATQSVQAMVESCSNAELAVEKARECGRSLSNITESVANIDSMSTQIAASAEEQSYVAEDVSKRITLISDSTETTLTNINELATSVETQQALVLSLVGQVEHFQLKHDES